MIRYILCMVLTIFVLFTSNFEANAKILIFKYFVKDATISQINENIKDFALNNNCAISYKNSDMSSIVFKRERNSISKAWSNYPESFYNLEIELDENYNGTNVEIISNPVIENSTSFITGVDFTRYLKSKYSVDKIKDLQKISLKHREKQSIVDKLKIDALKNLINQINTNIYNSKDTDFSENIDLIQKGIFKKGERQLSYNKRYLRIYSVIKDKKILEYDMSGNLKKIFITSGSEYPKINYIYNYPDGLLRNIIIDLSEADDDEYFLDPNGNYVDVKKYKNNFQDNIKKHWYPQNSRVSYRTECMITIDKSGKLLDYKIIRSSNDLIKDAEALTAIKTSAPFEALPSNYGLDSVDVQFNFDYNVFSSF